MQLSNFDFMEDSKTGHILVHLHRYRGGSNWDAPGNGPETYEIEVR